MRYCLNDDVKNQKKFCENQSAQIFQSIDIQRRILDVLETSQEHRLPHRRDDQESELLRILASDYKSDKDSISKRVPGTCEWFLRTTGFWIGGTVRIQDFSGSLQGLGAESLCYHDA